MWDRSERCQEELNGVERDELIGHFERLFFSGSTRRLDIELVSQAHAEE